MYKRNSSFFISVIAFLPGFLVKTQSFLILSTLLVSLAPSLIYARLQLPRAWNRLIKTQQNHTSTSRPCHPFHDIGTVFLLSKYALREKLNTERHKFFHPIILFFFYKNTVWEVCTILIPFLRPFLQSPSKLRQRHRSQETKMAYAAAEKWKIFSLGRKSNILV